MNEGYDPWNEVHKLRQRIAELEKSLAYEIDMASLAAVCKDRRIAELEELVLSIRKQGELSSIINVMIREADKIAESRGGWDALLEKNKNDSGQDH
jgi:cell division septum initiation protein DivIVA